MLTHNLLSYELVSYEYIISFTETVINSFTFSQLLHKYKTEYNKENGSHRLPVHNTLNWCETAALFPVNRNSHALVPTAVQHMIWSQRFVLGFWIIIRFPQKKLWSISYAGNHVLVAVIERFC